MITYDNFTDSLRVNCEFLRISTSWCIKFASTIRCVNSVYVNISIVWVSITYPHKNLPLLRNSRLNFEAQAHNCSILPWLAIEMTLNELSLYCSDVDCYQRWLFKKSKSRFFWSLLSEANYALAGTVLKNNWKLFFGMWSMIDTH